MATETGGEQRSEDAGFGRVSRVRGRVFQYLTFGASLFGIVSLAVLLGYVIWDAAGLNTAGPAWYALALATVVSPGAAFVEYARRRPQIKSAAIELLAIIVGGVLTGFALVVVLAVIAGAERWFVYFLTTALPLAAVYLYSRTAEVGWGGLALLGVTIGGPLLGSLLMEPVSAVGAYIGSPAIFYLSVLVPTALLVRSLVDDRLGLGQGNNAALAVLLLPVLAIPVVDTVPLVDRSVWVIFAATLITPVGLVLWKNLSDSRRRAGLVGPLVLILGLGALAIVPDMLNVAGPSPWFDWQYLSSSPSQTAERAGLYPAIIGSVFMIVLVALLTLVLGVGSALYLEEYAPSSGPMGAVTRLIRINISNLAGVPSVVYGILGLAVFANTLGLGFGTVVTAAFTLSLLILPIVIIASREAIRAVPDSMRDASYGMGATRWQTIRNVVMPRAIPGILTGTILALGRAIGETAPLIMIGVATTKFSPPSGLFGKMTAMPMQVYTWASYPSAAFQHGVVAAGVVTLLIVLLTMNSVAVVVRNRIEQGDY